MKKQLYYFGEYAFYSTPEEEVEARKYLEYWKVNLLKKICGEVFKYNVVHQDWLVREPHLDGTLCQRAKLILKLCVEVTHSFSVDNFIGESQ